MNLDKILTLIRNKKKYIFFSVPFLLIPVAAMIMSSPQTSTYKNNLQPSISSLAPTRVMPTTPETTIKPQTKILLQKQDASEIQQAEEQAAIQKDYPWFNSLPLQESNYFVYFDVNKKSFVGLLYPKTSSSVSVDNQVAQMKTEAQAKLTQKSIPWQNYQFSWKVTPK
jgi:hypothetical protein